jgi:hypothetical protein
VRLAIAETLLATFEIEQSRIEVELLLEDALLHLRDLDAAILDLALDLAAQCDRLLTCIDLCFAPERLGLTLGVPEELLALHARRADARA